eukprot:9077481-Pyramimonas_sp.AAC.1
MGGISRRLKKAKLGRAAPPTAAPSELWRVLLCPRDDRPQQQRQGLGALQPPSTRRLPRLIPSGIGRRQDQGRDASSLAPERGYSSEEEQPVGPRRQAHLPYHGPDRQILLFIM